VNNNTPSLAEWITPQNDIKSHFRVLIMIKCVSPYADSGHHMVKEIFNAYTNPDSQRFVFEASHDLPQEVDSVMSESQKIVYIAWKFDHCIALEIVSKSENDEQHEQHFDVIVSCENDYMSEFECKAWLANVSKKAVASTTEKIQVDVDSTLVMHTEVHSVYPNSVMSFSASRVSKELLGINRKVVCAWVEQDFPMCLSAPLRKLH
jgi:hypothetical protein